MQKAIEEAKKFVCTTKDRIVKDAKEFIQNVDWKKVAIGVAGTLAVAAVVVATGFGASDVIEGIQDLGNGVTGNSEKVAFNPIRDTVFKNQPELYYLTETVVTYGAGYGSQMINENRTYVEATVGNGSQSGTYYNPLENIEYTEKVSEQMKQNDYHSFPESVDAFGADGKATQIVGGDGITRTKIEISGSYKGKDGTFEYIIEPDGKLSLIHI